MQRLWSQSFFLPEPPITETNCPDQTGRVFIVTGGYAGVGAELSRILYHHNATVYIAGRSASKADAAMKQITTVVPNSKGQLKFMNLDLSDWSTIKPAVEAFTASEDKLHVLVNNAGVMFPPAGSMDKHGVELTISTNCVGPYLLYKLLKPILMKTAAASPKGSVRVAWAGSAGVDVMSHKPGGMKLEADGKPADLGVQTNYGQSKVANLYFARHEARTTPTDHIVHSAFNPGNLKTELQRHASRIQNALVAWMLYPAVFGAYTELWAAISPDLTPEQSGAYVWPWGRTGGFREDIEKALKSESEGGTGQAAKFVSWCDKVSAQYA